MKGEKRTLGQISECLGEAGDFARKSSCSGCWWRQWESLQLQAFLATAVFSASQLISVQSQTDWVETRILSLCCGTTCSFCLNQKLQPRIRQLREEYFFAFWHLDLSKMMRCRQKTRLIRSLWITVHKNNKNRKKINETHTSGNFDSQTLLLEKHSFAYSLESSFSQVCSFLLEAIDLLMLSRKHKAGRKALLDLAFLRFPRTWNVFPASFIDVLWSSIHQLHFCQYGGHEGAQEGSFI